MKELLAAGPLQLTFTTANYINPMRSVVVGRRFAVGDPTGTNGPDRDGRRAHRLRARRARRPRRRVRQRRLDGDRPRRVQAAARQGDPDRRLRRRGGRPDRLARLRGHAARRGARAFRRRVADGHGRHAVRAGQAVGAHAGRPLELRRRRGLQRGRPVRLHGAAELQARPVRPPGVLRRRDPVGAVHLARLPQPGPARHVREHPAAARTRPSPSTTARPTA